MNKMDFVIPARSGSKGIPDKNIKYLSGFPLMSWSIMAALGTKLGDVYVSSDSKKYLDIAEDYNAIGVKRPKKISNGKSSSEEAILDVLKKHNLSDTICFLQCTSPWIISDDILGAYKQYKKDAPRSLIFAKEAHTYPYSYNAKKKLGISYYGNERKMRQGMSNVVEVGAYIFDKKEFIKTGNRLGSTLYKSIYTIDRELPNEIDSPMDWEINEEYFSTWCGVK